LGLLLDTFKQDNKNLLAKIYILYDK
jgi:hypothetical protein